MKTKCLKQSVEHVRIKINFDMCITINPLGRKGGLALMWTNNSAILNFSQFHIHVRIRDLGLKYD